MDVEQLVGGGPRGPPGPRLTAVRPAALVGDGVDTVTTRHFEAPRLLTLRGAEAGLAVLPRRRPGVGRGAVVAAGHRPAPSRSAPRATSTQERPRAAHRDAPGRAQPGGGDGNCRPPPPRWGVAGTRQRPGFRRLPLGGLLRARCWVAGWVPVHDNETCLGVLLDGDPGLARGGGPPAGPQGRRPGSGQCRGGPGGHGSDHAATPQERCDGMTEPTGQRSSTAGRRSCSATSATSRCSVDEVLAAVRHPRCGGIAAVRRRGPRPRPRRGGDRPRLLRAPQRRGRAGAGLPRGRRPRTRSSRLAAVHRVGHLEIGDLAVVAAVSRRRTAARRSRPAAT